MSMKEKKLIEIFKLSGFKSMGMVGRHVFVDDGVKNESDNKQLDFSLVGGRGTCTFKR